MCCLVFESADEKLWVKTYLRRTLWANKYFINMCCPISRRVFFRWSYTLSRDYFSMSPWIPGLKPEATISPHPRCVDVFRMKAIIKVSGKIEVGMAGQSIFGSCSINRYPSFSNREPGHSEWASGFFTFRGFVTIRPRDAKNLWRLGVSCSLPMVLMTGYASQICRLPLLINPSAFLKWVAFSLGKYPIVERGHRLGIIFRCRPESPG